MEKVILFGFGEKFKYEMTVNYQELSDVEVVAIADNNSGLWGMKYNEIPIIDPISIMGIIFDRIIVLTKYYSSIVNQLINIGVSSNKIIYWDEFVAKKKSGKFKLYPGKVKKNIKTKRVILMTVPLGYNGGTIALINAAKALKQNKYDVVLCTPKTDNKIISTLVAANISTLVIPSLMYPDNSILELTKEYDYIIVNTFQMIRTAIYISRYRSVIWWLHEPGSKYSNIYKETLSVSYGWNFNDNNKIEICVVSNRAADAFKEFFPAIKTNLLPLGVEDYFVYNKAKAANSLVVAITGKLEPLKNQLKTVMALIEGDISEEIWIIGKIPETDYASNILDFAKKNKNIKIWGEVEHDNYMKMLADIDIVLCPSLEETMSISVIEGLMQKKICVVSNNTGIADYIQDGINGFLYDPDDMINLEKIMQFIVSEYRCLKDIGEMGRKTYLEHFTLEKVGNRFELFLRNE